MTKSKLFGLVVILAAGLFCSFAQAVQIVNLENGVRVHQTDNLWKVFFSSGATEEGSRLSGLTAGQVARTGTGVKTSLARSINIGTYQAAINIAAETPTSAILNATKGLLKVGPTGLALSVGLTAAPYIYEWLTDSGITVDSDGDLVAVDSSGSVLSDGYIYSGEFNGIWYRHGTPSGVCQLASSGYSNSYGYTIDIASVKDSAGYRCSGYIYTSSGTVVQSVAFRVSKNSGLCAAGSYWSSGFTSCTETAGVAAKISLDDIDWNQVVDLSGQTAPVKNSSGQVQLSKDYKANVLSELWDLCNSTGSCDPVALLEATSGTTVTGPSTVAGTKSTTTSGNKTTTTQKSLALSYSGDTVTADEKTTATTATTTTTTDSDGNTTTTVVTTTEETTSDPEVAPTDTALPDQPTLYERKYPDGIVGVWNTKKDELSGTSLATFAASLMPSYNSGSCPSWSLPLSFSSWANYGSMDVAPDCSLWGYAKAILIVCALLLARRLIFGG